MSNFSAWPVQSSNQLSLQKEAYKDPKSLKQTQSLYESQIIHIRPTAVQKKTFIFKLHQQ